MGSRRCRQAAPPIPRVFVSLYSSWQCASFRSLLQRPQMRRSEEVHLQTSHGGQAQLLWESNARWDLEYEAICSRGLSLNVRAC